MGDAIAMTRPGTQFSGDGISLSWPKNRDGTPGQREVLEVPPGRRSPRVKQMIVDGALSEVDLPPTPIAPSVGDNRRLFAGGSAEALARMREPAGPVIRQMFAPAGEVADVEVQSVDLSDDPTRRPAPPSPPEEQALADPPEPTYDELVTKMVADNTLKELRAQADELGVKPDGDTKSALAAAIVTELLDQG